jgi:hypothetical protein
VAKRQISEAEKQIVLTRQGDRCFVDNAPFADPSDVEYDHINPFAEGGASEIANIGAVCKKHNREKSTLSLSEYRDRLALRRFFEGAKKRRLDDLLDSRLGSKGYGLALQTEVKDRRVLLYLDGGTVETPLSTCPATSERYFFATLPVELLRNDGDLQPRPLEFDRVWELYKHLRSHTQLAPAVCRLVDGHVVLFDGQHKAAAQVWAGRSVLDCKVYLDPDVRRLKETNLSAHDRLRQMPFYTSTLLEKYADMAHEDWEAFLLAPGPKTEAAFIDFMRVRANLTGAEAARRVRSLIYRDIIEHPQNRFRDFIEEENRGRKNPITIGRLEEDLLLGVHRRAAPERRVRVGGIPPRRGARPRGSPAQPRGGSRSEREVGARAKRRRAPEGRSPLLGRCAPRMGAVPAGRDRPIVAAVFGR